MIFEPKATLKELAWTERYIYRMVKIMDKMTKQIKKNERDIKRLKGGNKHGRSNR